MDSITESVNRLRQALDRHDDLFELLLDTTESPASEEEIAAVESRLEMKLPASLRAFYLSVGSLRFEWGTRSATCLERGFREELAYQQACLHLGAVYTLTPARGEPRVFPFTSDSFGHSWCFDLRWGIDPIPIVWFDHSWLGDDTDPIYDSFEEFWVDYADYGFVSRPTSQADLIYHVLHSDMAPTPKAV